MHDDEDDEIRRQNYERLFGTTAEREAEACEMEERAAKLKTAETLAWCMQRAEARAESRDNITTSRTTTVPCDGAGRPLNDPRNRLEPEVVTKSYAPVAAASADPDWGKWRKFILSVVGKKFISDDMLARVLKKVAETANERDAEIYQTTKKLRDEVAQLRAELAELRALRSQPTSVDEERKRAGEIRRQRQELDRLRVA